MAQAPDQSLNLWPEVCSGPQLRHLRKLQHLDLSMNNFSQVPACVVAMPMLLWLDMGGNRLQQLPEDLHR